jgi:hypothetical protein
MKNAKKVKKICRRPFFHLTPDVSAQYNYVNAGPAEFA